MTHATLSLMSLNTWGFAWPLAKHRSTRFKRIAAHLKAASYDVVAFQELWGGARQTLGATGMTWVGDEGRLNSHTQMVRSGLGLKVRDQLAKGAHAIRSLVGSFPLHAGFDRAKDKGFFGVEVPVGQHRVAVISTHLQAGLRYAKTRRAQIDHLLEASESCDLPVVLCGDFNLFDHSNEDRAGHNSLDSHGFSDASLWVKHPQATYLRQNPYVGGSEDFRFDRIYIRPGKGAGGETIYLRPQTIDVIVDHAAPMSDHEAICAKLKLEVHP